jgi:hypothetical protein
MRSWKNLLDLSSDAWHGIGDTSTDVNNNINKIYLILFLFLFYYYRLIGIQNDYYLLLFIKVQKFICYKINLLIKLIQ